MPITSTQGGRSSVEVDRVAGLRRLVTVCGSAQRGLVAAPMRTSSRRYSHAVARSAADLPSDPAVVVTNPDEEASPEAFRAFIDDLLSGPLPGLESIDAAEALRLLRVDASNHA